MQNSDDITEISKNGFCKIPSGIIKSGYLMSSFAITYYIKFTPFDFLESLSGLGYLTVLQMDQNYCNDLKLFLFRIRT